MIDGNIYAVEPKSLMNWQDCRFIAQSCDEGQGRFIAAFPASWWSMIRESLKECDDVEKLRIAEALKPLRTRLKTANAYPQTLLESEWLGEAIEHVDVSNWEAVIAADNPGQHPLVFTIDSLSHTKAPWAVDESAAFPWIGRLEYVAQTCLRRALITCRRAPDHLEALALYLGKAAEVLLFDRLFKPMRDGHCPTMPVRAPAARLKPAWDFFRGNKDWIGLGGMYCALDSASRYSDDFALAVQASLNAVTGGESAIILDRATLDGLDTLTTIRNDGSHTELLAESKRDKMIELIFDGDQPGKLLQALGVLP